jgi:hypothetical protein
VALSLLPRLRRPARATSGLRRPAFAPVVAGEGPNRLVLAGGVPAGPRWHEPARPGRQPWFVRPAEVIMLSLSFFLAAHLVGGGVPEARAPQDSLSLVPSIARLAPSRIIEVTPTNVVRAVAATNHAGAAPAESAVERSAAPTPAPAPAPGTTNATATDLHRPPATPEPTPEPRAAPAPLPVAVAPPAPSQPPLTQAQIIAYAIEAGWPAEWLDSLVRVAWCESRFRADAVGYGAYGLMQVVPLWFDYAGLDFGLWSDPVVNLKAALAAFNYSEARGHRPWAQWSCKPEAITIP